MLESFLGQERAPVCTAISLFTTAAIEIVILLLLEALARGGLGFGAIGAGMFTAFLIFLGLFINIIAGSAANNRGELWGGRIAIAGVGVWAMTIAVGIWAKILFPR